MPLDGFKNLTSLELYNCYGNFALLIKDLVTVLTDCPGLKLFGLGVQFEDDLRGIPDDLDVNYEIEFLEKLCVDYGSRDGTSPLPLDTLRLGNHMFLYDPCYRYGGKDRIYLQKLVQLDRLRNFHIYNGSIYHGDEDDDMQVDWRQLIECKSLEQLSVTRFTEDIQNWLVDFGSSVKDLIITDCYSPYEEDLDHFDLLEDVHLSMLFIQSKLGSTSDLDDWLDRIDDPWDTARIDADEITVLDRLPDGGAHLTRLGLSLDFETQWVRQTTLTLLILGFADLQ